MPTEPPPGSGPLPQFCSDQCGHSAATTGSHTPTPAWPPTEAPCWVSGSTSPRTGRGSKSPMPMPSPAQPVLFRCLAQAGAARGSENRPVINFPAAGGVGVVLTHPRRLCLSLKRGADNRDTWTRKGEGGREGEQGSCWNSLQVSSFVSGRI